MHVKLYAHLKMLDVNYISKKVNLYLNPHFLPANVVRYTSTSM